MQTQRSSITLLATVFGLACAAPALAASAPLVNSVAPFSSAVHVVGEADPASMVHFQVALRLRDFAGMNASNRAGQRLLPADLAARHLPTQQDHDAVVAWLKSEGLSIDATVPSRLTISASGRADTVSRALGVHFSHITADGKDYVAADSAPSIPENLAGIVLSVNGLQPHLHAHTMHVAMPLAHHVSATPRAGTIPYVPSDLKNAYTATSGGTGTGTTTAIVIDTFPLKTDLTQFWSEAGISDTLSNITFIQAVPGTLPKPSGEETLDTEYSSGMAPASKVRVYAAQSLANSALDTTFQRVITDQQNGVFITQVSISLGECETDISSGEAQTDDQYFATMTSLGASVFVSSGDSGSHECGGSANVPSYYSTDPNVAAVGGTTLHMSGTTETSETGWSGSGGGISQFWAKPSYQSKLTYGARAVPDLAAVANPNTGVLVVLQGQDNQFGGTSVASPVVAGLMGLVNSKRIAAGKATLGLLDPRIYPLVGTTNFRDIKTGSNGGYSAKVGYDLVTGIGAPLLAALLPTLVAQQ